MAAVNGAPAPSLSSLQTALRKAPLVKAGAPTSAAKPGQPTAAPQGVKRPLPSDAAAAGGASPVKKIIVKSAATGAILVKAGPGAAVVAKTPGAGTVTKAAGGGGLAKAPSVAKVPAAGAVPSGKAPVGKVPGPATAAKAPMGAAKAPVGPTAAKGAAVVRVVKQPPVVGAVMKAPGAGVGTVAKVPGVAAPKQPMAAKALQAALPGPGLATKAGAPVLAQPAPLQLDGAAALSKGQDGGLSPAVITELVSAIEGTAGAAKVRSVVRLADAIGQSLQIDHINHFLRALKKKVIERAQQDGVRVPVTKASPAPAPAKPAALGQPAAVVKAAAAVPGAPKAPVKAAAPQQPQPTAAAKVAAGAPPQMPKAKPAPVGKPKPPQPPPQQPTPSAAPTPASPAAESADDGSLYLLVGEIAADPVCVNGEINDARLAAVLKRLWDGAAKKGKDWIAAWQAMAIPVEKQTEALNKFMNMAFLNPADPDRAPMVIAELVKAHKVKMRSVEDVLVAFGHNLDGILAINEEAWHLYALFLVHVYPKPQGAGWGWSRVGWSWQSWWKFVELCISTLEPARGSDVVCMILRLIQDREGQSLEETQGWTEGDKLQRVVAKLSELGSCDAAEVAEKLALQGVHITV